MRDRSDSVSHHIAISSSYNNTDESVNCIVVYGVYFYIILLVIKQLHISIVLHMVIPTWFSYVGVMQTNSVNQILNDTLNKFYLLYSIRLR